MGRVPLSGVCLGVAVGALGAIALLVPKTIGGMVRTIGRVRAAAPTNAGGMTAPAPSALAATRVRYGGLVAMMLTSFLLVTAEFLPNGVLTQMARGMGVTPGQAGQTVTITAAVGLVVAPVVGILVPRMDRRTLLIWMAAAAAVSNLLVAVAPTLPFVLAARVLLGVAIASYWTMSITVAARLTGPERLGRGVMFTSAGVSVATVAGVPVAVLLSTALDWRAVFALLGGATAALIPAMWFLLPPVPAERASGLRALWDTARRPGAALGLSGHVIVVLGHFLAYTYVRVALERIPDARPTTIVVLLALFGVGGLLGNISIGLVVDRAFVVLSMLTPVLIGVAVVAVVALPHSLIAEAVIVTVWGFLFSSWLIVVNTWVGHRMPDRLEVGGSLVVVGFQAGIVIAAALGGVLVDTVGVAVGYLLGAAVLLLGAVLFGASHRARS